MAAVITASHGVGGDHGLAVTAVTGEVAVTTVTSRHGARAESSPIQTRIRLVKIPLSLARWS